MFINSFGVHVGRPLVSLSVVSVLLSPVFLHPLLRLDEELKEAADSSR